VNLLTEDNLPSYHHEIALIFGREHAWGEWVHRWTAEEGRHAIAMRDYMLVARKVDPHILDELVRVPGVPVVAITGSNGKTTTARFTAALLRGEGITVCHNSAGANLVQGVTSLAVSYASLRGRLPDGVLVELHAPKIIPNAIAVEKKADWSFI